MNERRKFVITRKNHRCEGCGRVFSAGTKMESCTFIDASGENGWCTWHLCETCQEVLKKNYDACTDINGCICEGSIRENDPDLWEEQRAKIEAPERASDLEHRSGTPKEGKE